MRHRGVRTWRLHRTHCRAIEPLHCDRSSTLADRVVRLSATFRRSLVTLGIEPGSAAFRTVFATIAALADAAELPGCTDHQTSFSPGRAQIRRVAGHNVWLLYRFDAVHVFIMTARGEPPVPLDN